MKASNTFLISVVFFLFQANLIGQEFRFTNSISDSPLNPSSQPNSFILEEDQLSTTTFYDEIDEIKYIKNAVFLEFDKDMINSPAGWFRFEYEVKIELWEGTSGSYSSTPDHVEYVDLEVFYSDDPEESCTYISSVYFTGYHKMEVTLISKDFSGPGASAPWPTINLTGEILLRYEYLPMDFITTNPTFTNLDFNQVHSDFFTLEWDEISGATSYEIAYAFLDSMSVEGAHILNQPSTTKIFERLFHKVNSTSVLINDLSYDVPLIYPSGTLLFRMRGVLERDGRNTVYTPWTFGNDNSEFNFKPMDFEEKIQVKGHHPKLNWQYQNQMAEDGKYVPSVTYYDGTLRSRQTVTLSRSIDRIIVGQTLYDRQGRPSIDVLPMPLESNDIEFYPFFAINGSGDPYSFSDFDLPSENCVDPPPPLGTNLATSGRYFSTDNPDAGNGHHQFIPDASGFPFSMKTYTPDNTGRISSSGGVGEELQVGTGNETRFFYGKPSQEELDRLFGNNVGWNNHYLKNMSIDPNDQTLVEYKDYLGRTIATALSGDKPEFALNNDDGNYPTAADEITIDLLNNSSLNKTIESSYTLLLSQSGDVEMTYESGVDLFSPDCLPSGICYECHYTVFISITDGCGYEFLFDSTNIKAEDLIYTACDSASNGILKFMVLEDLPPGSYNITKQLTLAEGTVNRYLEDFLEYESCIPSYEDLLETYISNIDFSGCEFSCEECMEGLPSWEEFLVVYFSGVPDTLLAPGALDTLQAHKDYLELKEQCSDLCATVGDCDARRLMLLMDVSPFGQYADLDLTTGTPVVTDPSSVFYGFEEDTAAYQKIDTYFNKFGDTSMVYYGGELVSPSNLPPDLFIEVWDFAWASQLAEMAHPEWACFEEWCSESMMESDSFDQLLLSIETYDEAISMDVFKGSSGAQIKNDPFFESGGAGYDQLYRDKMEDYLENVPNDEGYDGISLEEVVSKMVYGVNCTECIGMGNAIENNQAWQVFRSFYLGFKQEVRNEVQDCDVELQGESKEPRIMPVPGNWNIDSFDDETVDSLLNEHEDSMDEHCATVCEGLADRWMIQLEGCSLSVGDSANIKLRLIEVCKLGCDEFRPFGSSNTGSSEITTSYGDSSFTQIIEDVLGATADLCDEDCNPYSIQFPPPHQMAQNAYGGKFVKNLDPCICENLLTLAEESCYNPEDSVDLFGWLSQFYNYVPYQPDIDTLLAYCSCEGQSQTELPYPLYVPSFLQCDVCYDCDTLQQVLAEFNALCPVDSSDTEYDILLQYYFNAELGFHYTYLDYYDFFDLCSHSDTMDFCEQLIQLCPDYGFGPLNEEDNCMTELIAHAEYQAQTRHQFMIDSVSNWFVNNYFSQCLGSIEEEFTASYNLSEYHYTLYFFDQAGNLVQTVPPEGVDLLNESEIEDVDAHRVDPGSNPPVFPNHNYATKYRYNSQNQVIKTISPDMDSIMYFYDKAGRMVASQDGRQRIKQPLDRHFTYSLYDNRSRLIETGEVESDSEVSRDFFLEYVDVVNWIMGLDDEHREKVIKTFYDESVPNLNIPAFNVEGQSNLRNRVSSTTFSNKYNPDPDDYTYATHYSYDIAGNVQTLVQEYSELHALGQGFKRIDYEYDLISANVHAVWYQRDSVDQFTYRYVYDEDNRLEESLTSFTGTTPLDFHYYREAGYTYYDHGPLARVQLANDGVQGLDYAYTIQGWLKGLNSSAIHPLRDMGMDGTGQGYGSLSIPTDELGFTLGYFGGDYAPIGETDAQFELDYSGSDFDDASPSLYNGNIRHLSLHNKSLNNEPIGYAYRYDQLNRLTKMSTYENPDTTDEYWTWCPGSFTHRYGQEFKYDANGNITNQTRLDDSGNSAGLIDDLQYHYYPGTNRLEYVANSGTVDPTDHPQVPDQNPENYLYDRSGNLVQDCSELLETIIWNHFGKATMIRKGLVSDNIEIHMGYDAQQQRIKKQVIEKSIEIPIELPEGTDCFPNDPQHEHEVTDTLPTTWYVRDATGNVLAVYEQEDDTLRWKEQHLFGSSRLGMVQPDVVVSPLPYQKIVPHFIRNKEQPYGARRYELSNHLGNVMAVLSDRKMPRDLGSSVAYDAVVHSAADYYPFGSLMTGRTYSAGGYRYGFNTMEMDDEVKGVGNSLDFGARIYDSRLGRWLSLDPLKEKYPFASPYNFALNTPIQAFDPDGRLVVFVNGFMVDQWATSNRGEYTTFDGAHVTIPHRPYPTFEMSTGSRPVYLGQEFNYWSGVDDAFMERFEDHNSLYLSGSDRRTSSANERFNAGKQSGIELLQKIQNGEITLEKEETIKIVAHSQGAAHGAGMAQVLNQAFKDGVLENPVEQIYYLAPHQPGDFATPEGIFSAQYSRESDKVSSRGLISTRTVSGGSTFSMIFGVDEKPDMPNMNKERGGHNVGTFMQIFSIFKKGQDGYVRPREQD